MCILTPLYGEPAWTTVLVKSAFIQGGLPVLAASGLITVLYWGIFWAAVLVFIVAEGLLIYTTLHWRRHSSQHASAATRQHIMRNIRDVMWMSIPALAGVTILAMVFQVMQTKQPHTTVAQPAEPLPLSTASACFHPNVSAWQAADLLETAPLTIELTARQWWWDVDYPGYGFFTADDMYVPTDAVVILQMDSQQQQTQHWWVPQVDRPQQVAPGSITSTWFAVAEPGVYESRCPLEECGAVSSAMPTRVVALAPAEFQRWVAQQQEPVPQPATPLQEQGKALLGTKGCIGCHAIRGISVSSRVGPNLTNMASRERIAGIMPYSQENMRRWLAMPIELKPGSKMPNLNLSDAELDALVAYLDTFK
jgi:cytochrome c oxidase subunit 2